MKFNYLLGLGILLSLIGATLLLALGILYIRPFIDTRNYAKGDCLVTSKNTTSKRIVCQCSADGNQPCTSTYPCARVRVQLTTSRSSVHPNIILYDSYETYTLQKVSYHVSIFFESKNDFK